MSSASRRAFLRRGSLAAAAALAPGIGNSFAWAQAGQAPPGPVPAPDYRLEIAETDWELAPKTKIRVAAYNGQIPGPILRLTEGKPATIEITNRVDWPEIVHCHGQWIPVAADGTPEEGSPMIAPGARARIGFTPRPSGLHWYHTHVMAGRNLKRGLYTGQFGVLHVAPAIDPGLYDREQFIVLHDWVPYFANGGDGAETVAYARSSINGRLLGHGEPIQVRAGQRVLFQILNASASETHWLVLPGHQFQVLALDGAPVATEAKVDMLRLGAAERITALVTMNTPGVWVFGEAQRVYRNAGMGIVVEYAGRSAKPQEPDVNALQWDYRDFGDAVARAYTPDVRVPMVFTSRFTGQGSLGEWEINKNSWPHGAPMPLHPGQRHRLVFENRNNNDHPVHIHRHNFELVSMAGKPMSGVHKDVVMVEAGTTVEADLVANNPGNTLFHCHVQEHMDFGFMALFRYV